MFCQTAAPLPGMTQSHADPWMQGAVGTLQKLVVKDAEKNLKHHAGRSQTLSMSKIKYLVSYPCDERLMVYYNSALFHKVIFHPQIMICLLYTSDAADDLL